MSGVPIIVQLLLAAPGVRALVKADNIVGDDLPQGTDLPAIAVQSISRVTHNPLTPGSKRHVAERVQANVLGATAPQLGAVIKAVRSAAAYKMPTFGDITDIVVILYDAGPSGRDVATGIRAQGQDFSVSYNEPA